MVYPGVIKLGCGSGFSKNLDRGPVFSPRLDTDLVNLNPDPKLCSWSYMSIQAEPDNVLQGGHLTIYV